jgi:hypothetical protein
MQGEAERTPPAQNSLCPTFGTSSLGADGTKRGSLGGTLEAGLPDRHEAIALLAERRYFPFSSKCFRLGGFCPFLDGINSSSAPSI